MIDRVRDSNQDLAERLIGAEVDSALAEFRSGHFEAEVREKIRDMSPTIHVVPFAHSFRRPVWIAAGLVLLAGAIMLTLLFHRTPRPAMARAVEAGLQQAPGMYALEHRETERNVAKETMITSPMNMRIQTALLQRGQYLGAAPDESPSSAGQRRRNRPMTIEEIYKILVIDKSVERVLALVSYKTRGGDL